MVRTLLACLSTMGALFGTASADEAQLALELSRQVETSKASGRYHRLQSSEEWNCRETALIVCDVWDYHHCLNAVRRVAEFGPLLNQVVAEARKRGVTIIHAPSDCMAAYADHPARRRAMATPKAAKLPADIGSWCSRIPAEERAKYPIDQSDGGEDDGAAEHAEWAKKLTVLGRNPKMPWKQQADLISIDSERDYISDRGDEVWSILEARGVKNVILTGVHTNMCVLGRPFGLRQMARNGKHVVLMRDMTDTMYNPKSWPYVSHFTGTDLIVSHIEKYVCPTITSDQIIGGEPFRFSGDKRPRLALLIAEDEYETEKTLPKFAAEHLDRGFCVSYIFGSATERNAIPGIDAVADADVLLVSVRRRVLPKADITLLQEFVAAGKPVVGIRTASHAFSLRDMPAPPGFTAWSEFDAQVLGGNYHGHHGNSLTAKVRVEKKSKDHAIIAGLSAAQFESRGSLYKTSPLVSGTVPLMVGRVEGEPEEPVAWTFKRADGGNSFYTSLGHKSDFENAAFVRLLTNGIYWAAGIAAPDAAAVGATSRATPRHWSLRRVPERQQPVVSAAQLRPGDSLWYRCAVQIPGAWKNEELRFLVAAETAKTGVWINGEPLMPGTDKSILYSAPKDTIVGGDANLLVVRLDGSNQPKGLAEAPIVIAGDHRLELAGNWQFRIGADPSWSNLPLPAKFGASTDILFQP